MSLWPTRGNENQCRRPRESGDPFSAAMDSRFRGNDESGGDFREAREGHSFRASGATLGSTHLTIRRECNKRAPKRPAKEQTRSTTAIQTS